MATAAACSAEKQKYKITEQPLTGTAFVPHEKYQIVRFLCATFPLDLLQVSLHLRPALCRILCSPENSPQLRSRS